MLSFTYTDAFMCAEFMYIPYEVQTWQSHVGRFLRIPKIPLSCRITHDNRVFLTYKMNHMNRIEVDSEVVSVYQVPDGRFEVGGDRARKIVPHPLHSCVEEEYSDSMILFGPSGEKIVPILQIGRVHLNIEQSSGVVTFCGEHKKQLKIFTKADDFQYQDQHGTQYSVFHHGIFDDIDTGDLFAQFDQLIGEENILGLPPCDKQIGASPMRGNLNSLILLSPMHDHNHKHDDDDEWINNTSLSFENIMRF